MEATEKYSPFVGTQTIDGVDRLFEYYGHSYRDRRRWAYRGQMRSAWWLSSKLERLLLSRASHHLAEALKWEARLYREFSRRCHHFGDTPAPEDVVEWLALMQHFGAPTRLVDFTYSFWVALYFALEDCQPDHSASVWMIDLDWVRAQVRSRLPEDVALSLEKGGKDPGAVGQLFQMNRQFVWPVNPYLLNQRLSIQQGVFLAQGDLTTPFMDNLCTLGSSEDTARHIIRVDIPGESLLHREIMSELHRMNVTRSSLFPGLDGMAQDLKGRLFMPELFEGAGDDGSIWERHAP